MVDQIHFMLQLLIAGFIFRYIQMKLLSRNPNSEGAKALAFVY